jgi:hypothetical protein
MRTFKNPAEYAAAMRAFSRAADANLKQAMKDIGKQFVGVCRQVLTEWIYDKPIPTKRSHRVYSKFQRSLLAQYGPRARFSAGWKMRAYKSDKIEWHLSGAGGKLAPKSRRLWTRTGNLRRLERFAIIPYRGWAAMITNIANRAGFYYASHRHWLRHTRFPGVVMAPAPWREEALDRTQGYRRQRLTDAILDAIKAKLA